VAQVCDPGDGQFRWLETACHKNKAADGARFQRSVKESLAGEKLLRSDVEQVVGFIRDHQEPA
jgi:hypothetical protein